MGAQHNEWYAARSMVALADGGDVVEMDDVLMARARSIRDTHYGPRITYSPKVFIPVTQLCRDVCHYCTFAKTPSQLSALYLEVDEISPPSAKVRVPGAERCCLRWERSLSCGIA